MAQTLPEIKTIEFLAHPFWFLDGLLSKGRTAFSKRELLFLKRYSQIWGQLVLHVKANSESILVITNRRFKNRAGKRPGIKKPIKLPDSSSLLEEHFLRFRNFAVRELGKRFVSVPESVYLNWNSRDIMNITRSSHFKLSKDCLIKARGEYSGPQYCVQKATELLKAELMQAGFNPKTEVVGKESIFDYAEGELKVREMQPWIRRKKQRERKYLMLKASKNRRGVK